MGDYIADKYQARYLAHQARKKKMFSSDYGTSKFKKYNKKEQKVFETILKNRSSQRIFNSNPVDLDKILKLAEHRPSSCDRRSILIYTAVTRNEKELLGGLLVGGVGWIHRADKILLFLAYEDAYKSPAEKDFMCYVDAGVTAQTIYLICESLNVGSCYVNPNIRDENQTFFKSRFIPDGYKFVGAMALGNFNLKHKK